jgi:hypothetical protein
MYVVEALPASSAALMRDVVASGAEQALLRIHSGLEQHRV